ncbi:MAG: hypothetical protein QXU32_00685 [Nitrososphaerales archaeon]
MYRDAGQIPSKPEDAGNITFVISSEDPKRSDGITLQLPVAEELRRRSGFTYNDRERRLALGELVFTLIETTRSQSGSSRKSFAIGEFLDFDDDQIELPDITGIPKHVDLQHNTNMLDLEEAGLSKEEISKLYDLSVARKRELENTLASLKMQANDKQVAINENQKRINETRKLIGAVEQIPGSNDILSKLKARELNLKNERAVLIADLDLLNSKIKETYDALLKISELVR